MTTKQEQDEAQKLAQEHPPSWSSIFGEDEGPNLFDDDQTLSPRSSAMAHAQRRFRSDRQNQQARDLATLQHVAQEEADDLDLAHALRLARAGKSVPRDIMAGAARAARSKGMALSSAEQLAMMARRS